MPTKWKAFFINKHSIITYTLGIANVISGMLHILIGSVTFGITFAAIGLFILSDVNLFYGIKKNSK